MKKRLLAWAMTLCLLAALMPAAAFAAELGDAELALPAGEAARSLLWASAEESLADEETETEADNSAADVEDAGEITGEDQETADESEESTEESEESTEESGEVLDEGEEIISEEAAAPVEDLLVEALPAAMDMESAAGDSGPSYDWYTGHMGEGPYLIASIGDLMGLAMLTQGKGSAVVGDTTITTDNFAGKTVQLAADLSFGEDDYWYYNDNNGTVKSYLIENFAGVFDGGYHTITGLKFYKQQISQFNLGLFTTITATGCVKNLTLKTVRADTAGGWTKQTRIGAIAYKLYGKAENCHVDGVTYNTVNGYLDSTGGMFGGIHDNAEVKDSTVKNVSITITGTDNGQYVGGFVGVLSSASGSTSISNCSVENVSFDLTCKLKRFGGFVGYAANTTMMDCTATNVNFDVDTYSYETGGFIGRATDGFVAEGCKVVGFTMCDRATNGTGGNIGGFAGTVTGERIRFTDCAATGLNFDLELANDYGFGVGGFAGQIGSKGAAFSGCSASGSIDAGSAGNADIPVGGFLGESHGGLTVSDCSTSVAVKAPEVAGGFVGACNGGTDTYTDCEATGSVESTSGVAGGMVGYIKPAATPNLGEGCIPATSVTGPITNEVANAQDRIYEIDSNGTIHSESTEWVCSVPLNPSYTLGYTSIQAALDAGANKVTLLKDTTENFVLAGEEHTDFVLELGAYTLTSTVTVHHKIHTVKISYTGDSNASTIRLTAPSGTHDVFQYWCSGDLDTGAAEQAAKDGDNWIAEPGKTYHPHFLSSSYLEIPEADRHLSFEAVYGYAVSEIQPKKITFTLKEEIQEDAAYQIAEFGASRYFTLDGKGTLTATILPKAGLSVGTYEERIYVTLADVDGTTSSHEIFISFVVQTAGSAVTPDVDSDTHTYIYGETMVLTAHVTADNSGIMTLALDAPATDTVAFYCGETLLGAVPVDYRGDTYPQQGTAELEYDTTLGGLGIGENTITAVYGGSVNLAGSQSDTITVTLQPKELTIEGLTAKERPYDATVDVTIAGGRLIGVLNGDDVSVTMPVSGTTEDKSVGVGKVVRFAEIQLAGTDAGFYTLTQPTATVTITPATLTVRYVSETIKTGETPKLEVKVDGFVGSDATSLPPASEYTAPTIADVPTAAGVYDLTPSGGVAVNYDFLYIAGTLTIQQSLVPVVPVDTIGYFVEHYKAADKTYSLAEREILSGKIGDPVEAEPKSYEGFCYNADKSIASGTLIAIDSDEDIVILKLYYDERITEPEDPEPEDPKPEEPEASAGDGTVPETGDKQPVGLLAALLALSMVGLGLVSVARKKSSHR